MTGRELILYILENRLEDEIVFKENAVLDLLTAEQVASKFNVGVETVKMWYSYRMLKGIKVGNSIFFFKNVTDPRKGGYYK